MAENTNNAPIKIEDEPFVGNINPEYRNSADVVGKPITPTTEPRRKYYEDAIKAEKASQVVVGVYGAAPYELDKDGNKVAVARMGDKPPRTVTFTVPAGTTDGTWLGRVGDQNTAALAYNISPAALKTALEALSTVGAGKVVSVTGGGVGVAYVVELDASVTGAVLANGAGLTPAGTVAVG